MQATIMIKAAFLICCSVLTLQSEVFDTSEPIMRLSPEINTAMKDFFGYTLVLHQLDVAGGVHNTRIVVSAPYGQASRTKLPRSSNDDSTGVLYTCPIGPGSCVGLTGDGNGDDRRLYDRDDNERTINNLQAEEKRGQFLGSTLKSINDTFLVCGHRYLDYAAGDDRNSYGVCYFSGRSLTSFSSYSPCNRNSRSFFGEGQCQAGTAGDVIDGNILLGAPGSFAWRGDVYRRSSAGQTGQSGNGVGSGPIGWQGYDVITGRIISKDFDFIVSVPRFNNYRGRVNIYPNDIALRPAGNPPLSGDQAGSYYGFSMAAADCRGRGMDDLLISSPMYSPENDRPEYGRVYVYRNDEGALSLLTTVNGRIPFGRFGHAMAKLGDINGDSLEDVAISAPYGDQSGTVYIYAGDINTVLSENPIQTIVGSSLNLPQLTGLRSFGASLSSNVDIDSNTYNDLAVGAYLSQKIFVLRTRPTARLEVNLNASYSFDAEQTLCNNRPCFNISSCVMYKGRGLQSTLQINYTLSADANAQGRPSRVRLTQEVGSVPTGQISGTLTLMREREICVNTTAVMNQGVPIVAQEFVVEFNATLASTRTPNPAWDGNMALSNLNSAPVLFISGTQSVTTRFMPNQMMRSKRGALSQTDELCGSATSCGDCIKLSADCIWCAQPVNKYYKMNYTTTMLNQSVRCVKRDSDHGCDTSFIEDPSGSVVTVMNQPLGGDEFVQVSPQNFRLNLRPGLAQNLTVSVRPANNFPLDVYFLMDQSFSMNDDLQSFKTLASQLASAINNITTNSQLGFGSFVDKPRAPYISLEPGRLTNPCRLSGVNCEPTYSFRHTLSLTSDASLFAQRIQGEVISGNLDTPEGGFDGLLQVIVCQDIIGWRKDARHVLVYLSDAGFHFAGDGKLGGVVIPHDGECYLQRSGNTFQYTMAEMLDYPSVGHISSLLQKFDIIPIFGVEARAQAFYESLRQILDFAVVGSLASDSSNIIDLIRDTYNTVSQTIRLAPDRVDGVTVEIIPLCQNAEGSTCTGVTIGQTVSFSVGVAVQACTDELMSDKNLTIRIPGFGQFVAEIAAVCECNCDKNPVNDSDFCNGNGDLVCGQCVCDPGWFGDTCQCDRSNNSLSEEGCPVGRNGVECTSNDRGRCNCGICECFQVDEERRYFGSACECDNFSCDIADNGLLCGGPRRGICGCDEKCQCLPGWSGPACNCTLSDDTCISSSGAVCNDQGKCVCGECICDSDSYSGEFCEICSGNACPTSPNVTEPPQIMISPMKLPLTVTVGDHLPLYCTAVSGVPIPKIQWLIGGTPAYPPPQVYQQIYIVPTNSPHRTTYTCVGSTFVEDVKVAEIAVNVTVNVLEPCSNLKRPRNGRIMMSEDNKLAFFSCNRGHILRGLSVLKCKNGKWNDSPPNCRAVSNLCRRTCNI